MKSAIIAATIASAAAFAPAPVAKTTSAVNAFEGMLFFLYCKCIRYEFLYCNIMIL